MELCKGGDIKLKRLFCFIVLFLIVFVINGDNTVSGLSEKTINTLSRIREDDPCILHEKNLSSSDGAGIRRIILFEDMCTLDLLMLELAQSVREECVEVLNSAIENAQLEETELFSTLYFPIVPLDYPPRFKTFYDEYFDEFINPVLDRYISVNSRLIYVVMVDKNGYVPTHNSKYMQPLTGNKTEDLKYNRAKKIFNDVSGFASAKNREDFLLQSYRRDTGEINADLSLPVYINNRHWGAVRVGYLRGE